jgi:hypothetical protein
MQHEQLDPTLAPRIVRREVHIHGRPYLAYDIPFSANECKRMYESSALQRVTLLVIDDSAFSGAAFELYCVDGNKNPHGTFAISVDLNTGELSLQMKRPGKTKCPPFEERANRVFRVRPRENHNVKFAVAESVLEAAKKATQACELILASAAAASAATLPVAAAIEVRSTKKARLRKTLTARAETTTTAAEPVPSMKREPNEGMSVLAVNASGQRAEGSAKGGQGGPWSFNSHSSPTLSSPMMSLLPNAREEDAPSMPVSLPQPSQSDHDATGSTKSKRRFSFQRKHAGAVEEGIEGEGEAKPPRKKKARVEPRRG